MRSTASPSSAGAAERTSARTFQPPSSSARTRLAPTNPLAPVTNAVGTRGISAPKTKGRLRTRSASQRSDGFVSVDVVAAMMMLFTSSRVIFTLLPGTSIASEPSSSRSVAIANSTGSTQKSRIRTAAAGSASM